MDEYILCTFLFTAQWTTYKKAKNTHFLLFLKLFVEHMPLMNNIMRILFFTSSPILHTFVSISIIKFHHSTLYPSGLTCSSTSKLGLEVHVLCIKWLMSVQTCVDYVVVVFGPM